MRRPGPAGPGRRLLRAWQVRAWQIREQVRTLVAHGQTGEPDAFAATLREVLTA